MFARTPVAKEFRRWVLDILDREVEESPAKPLPVIEGVPFTKSCHYLVTMSVDGAADIKPIDDDMFIGKVSSILNELRERGWIVIKRDLLAEKLAAW